MSATLTCGTTAESREDGKHTRCGTSGTVWSWSPLLSFWSKRDHFLPVTQVGLCSSSLGWICVWITSFFYRCWWGQSLLSAHRPQQWPVWSKLPQGTVWLGHPSANTDAVAGRADVLLSRQSPHTFSEPSRWPWVTLHGTRRDRVPPLLGWRSCSKPSFSPVILGSASQRSRADTKLTDHISLPSSVISSAVWATWMNTASGFSSGFTVSLHLLNIFISFLDSLNEKFLVIVTVLFSQ